jgi:GNAT superfamily N-acetyltransferase
MSTASDTDTKRPWSVRAFSRGDEDALADLYETVLQRAFDAPRWKWQFGEAASGTGYIMFADDDGTLAGQYATVPVRMQIQGAPARASLSLDTMTHPGYRKQGIFVALAKAVYAETARQGVRLVYGFPNDNSFPGFVKHLDFFVLDELPALVRPLLLERILERRVRMQWLARLIGVPMQALFDFFRLPRAREAELGVREEAAFPAAVTGLFERVAPHFRNLVVRDHDYLSWRYDRNPAFTYRRLFAYRGDELAGYCVCGETERRGVSIGLVVDLLAHPEDREVVTALLSAAVDAMKRKGTMTASIVLTPTSPFVPMVRRMGFLFPMRRFPFIVRANSGDADALETPADWHITLGDGDFV